MAQATSIPSRPGQTAATPYNTPATPAPTQMSRPQVPDAVAEGEEESQAPAGPNAGLTREQLLQNPAFASMVEGRLANLLGRSSGYIESLPVAVRHRVDGLQGLQVEQSKIEAEFQAEILELEKKYAKRYAPLFDQRAAIINGKQEPSDQLVDEGRKADQDDDDDDDQSDDEHAAAQPAAADRPKPTPAELESGPKGIPEFWATALKNHVGISDTITERDEELLKHLVDLRIEYLDGQKGFKLLFEFGDGAQEFFTNKNLEKTYIYQDEVGYEGDLVYDHAEGTQIDWKEGKDLTTRVETKKQRNKNTGQTRIIKKVVPSESFFSFFSPPSLDDQDDDEDEEGDAIEAKLELDYQIGEDLKERVIPRAVDFFTGKALRYANSMGDMDSDDEFDEDDDEDVDEDDDDDAPGAGRRLAPPQPSGATPASSQDPQECKQS